MSITQDGPLAVCTHTRHLTHAIRIHRMYDRFCHSRCRSRRRTETAKTARRCRSVRTCALPPSLCTCSSHYEILLAHAAAVPMLFVNPVPVLGMCSVSCRRASRPRQHACSAAPLHHPRGGVHQLRQLRLHSYTFPSLATNRNQSHLVCWSAKIPTRRNGQVGLRATVCRSIEPNIMLCMLGVRSVVLWGG